jgi:hypothetical protein
VKRGAGLQARCGTLSRRRVTERILFVPELFAGRLRARTIHEYLLRRPTRRPEPVGGAPILSPGVAILVRPPRRTACLGQQDTTPQNARTVRPRRTWLVGSIWSVWFIWFIWLVSFNQKTRQTRQTKRTRQTRMWRWRTFSASCSSPEREHTMLIAVLRLVPWREPDSRATHSPETIHR